MLHRLNRLVDFLLYSNLWIAICAAAMTAQSFYLLLGEIPSSPLLGFVFCSTLVLYAMHRIIGMSKVKAFQDQGRYAVIVQFKRHMLIYSGIAALGGIYFFFNLQRTTQLFCLLPVVIGAAYVLPVLQRGRRLRDFGPLKIFLIAIIWPSVTVLLPALEAGLFPNILIPGLFLEKVFFLLAITIPFDIRDATIDFQQGVKTLPILVGIPNAKKLGLLALVLSILMTTVLYYSGIFTEGNFLALLANGLSVGILLYFFSNVKHDYFYTGMLDGTMLLQSLLVIFWPN